ncbi:MAG: YscQ/HrcQ family type III secretion apparatus protein [Chlamydiae bacterium]|nr:YscQ/HrcQ family type III secretion apparatus protein [Chlamydiota bacterium]
MTKITEHWIKKLEPALHEKLEEKSGGLIPPFDFSTYSTKLSSNLHLKDLHIDSSICEWKSSEHLTVGFGTMPQIYAFESPILKGALFLIVAERDVEKFASWLEPNTYLSKDLAKGVFEYALLEAIDSLQSVEFYKPFVCQITNQTFAEKSSLYAIDLSFTYQEEILWARLALTKQAFIELKRHFSSLSFSLSSLPLFSDLPLDIHLHAGNVKLSQSAFDSLMPGDFIVLDESYFRPKSQKGTLELAVANIPLFQVKLKEGQLKILDFTYDSKEPIMDEDPAFEEEDAQQEDLLEEQEEDQEIKNEDSSLEKVKVEDIPLTVHVEVKRLKMTLKELQNLLPGETIALSSLGPIQSVYLTVQGHAVAEGELLELSDNVVGVKLHKIYR